MLCATSSQGAPVALMAMDGSEQRHSLYACANSTYIQAPSDSVSPGTMGLVSTLRMFPYYIVRPSRSR